ncbi:DUF937 domain-containing protein [Rhizobium halophytocola]|uniref:DUF937 domain-containing protein n=1 Tax=Rhizobium halophytocola TaxID=735519 RepID=A0ABS4DXT3_9HYPH|nr:DUF937 domain-containing protein [Rhizobium halophytocola]MBP1850501.1 hypothetical protein [Rhizobium halophytocola]
MLPLFDMMLRAQNGKAMEAMASQFNLAQEQAAQAMAALTPAFSSGLKRSASNPYDYTSLWQTLSSGNYAKYFEDMNKAFTPQGMADGNSVLEQLFGSKEVSRAIAAQAAQVTGIGQEIYKQMMPVMAGTLMGGLFKQATGQMNMANNPFANGPMAQMTQQWLENTGFAPKKPEPQAMNPFDNPFTQAFQQMMGMGTKKEAEPAANPFAGNPFFDNPFVKSLQDMMGGTAPTAEADAKDKKAQPKSKTKPAEDAAAMSAPFTDMMNSMFDSGLEVQKNYQKAVEQIMDGYMNDRTPADSATDGDDAPADPSVTPKGN